jgi:hypothetical protein
VLVVVYVPLLQPTVTSSATMLVKSGDGGDVMIGLLGYAVCLAPVAWLFDVLVLRKPFGAVAHYHSRVNNDDGCRFVCAQLQSRRYRWRDREGRSRFVRRYGAVFAEFADGFHWFILVELSVEAACGVLGGLVYLPTQQSSECFALKIAMVAVQGAIAIAFAVLRPSNTTLHTMAVLSNSVMGAAVAASVLLLSPELSAQLVFAQGIAAVSAALLSVVVLVLSGRARQTLRGFWEGATRAKHVVPPGCSSDSVDPAGSPCPLGSEVLVDADEVPLLADAIVVDDFDCGSDGADRTEDVIAADEYSASVTHGSTVEQLGTTCSSLLVALLERPLGCVLNHWR